MMRRVQRSIVYYVRGSTAFGIERLCMARLVVGGKWAYVQALRKKHFKRLLLLVYPEKPVSQHSLYTIAHKLGYRITNDPTSTPDLAVYFEDTTVRTPDACIEAVADRGVRVVNRRCIDISKEKVEEVFSRVFGYGMKVDPTKHHGVCVRKSNRNATHDGMIVQCPRDPESGYVYQKLIRTQEGDKVVDIRLSIFGDIIAHAFKRYKHLDDPFDHTINAVRVSVQDVISPEEERLVLAFCRGMGLECGELDLLRSVDDGRLYIVDANNTPYGPLVGLHISKKEYVDFLANISSAFEKAFASRARR